MVIRKNGDRSYRCYSVCRVFSWVGGELVEAQASLIGDLYGVLPVPHVLLFCGRIHAR